MPNIARWLPGTNLHDFYYVIELETQSICMSDYFVIIFDIYDKKLVYKRFDCHISKALNLTNELDLDHM